MLGVFFEVPSSKLRTNIPAPCLALRPARSGLLQAWFPDSVSGHCKPGVSRRPLCPCTDRPHSHVGAAERGPCPNPVFPRSTGLSLARLRMTEAFQRPHGSHGGSLQGSELELLAREFRAQRSGCPVEGGPFTAERSGAPHSVSFVCLMLVALARLWANTHGLAEAQGGFPSTLRGIHAGSPAGAIECQGRCEPSALRK